MFTYDDLYGVSLDEYCLKQETSLDELIRKIEIDIDLLNQNLERVLVMQLSHDEGYIVDTIFNLIKKKRNHVERLKEWNLNKATLE